MSVQSQFRSVRVVSSSESFVCAASKSVKKKRRSSTIAYARSSVVDSPAMRLRSRQLTLMLSDGIKSEARSPSSSSAQSMSKKMRESLGDSVKSLDKNTLRKTNQLRQKVKRAQCFERKRNLNELNQSGIIKQASLEEVKQEAEVTPTSSHYTNSNNSINTNNNNSDKVDETIASVKQETTSKINELGANLLNKFNSFKSKIKSVVLNSNNNGNINNNANKRIDPITKPVECKKENKDPIKLKPTINEKQPVICKKPELVTKLNRSTTTTAINSKYPKPIARAQQAESKTTTIKTIAAPSSIKPITNRLIKQESVTSLNMKREFSIPQQPAIKRCMKNFSSTRSLNQLPVSANSNVAIDKPAFKITKIKYDDSYLFNSNSEQNLRVDKEKYQKLITKRKVACLSTFTSTTSLNATSIGSRRNM